MKPSAMDRDTFVATFSDVFEHSPWIADAAWRASLTADQDSPAGLAAAMWAVVEQSDATAKLDLINAHPDLAGRLAIAGDLTADSTSEQASAGLDHCTPEEYKRFQDLNTSYKAKFGFPFIMAVRGSNRAAILAAFEQRVDNTPDAEFATALTEIAKIARLRIDHTWQTS